MVLTCYGPVILNLLPWDSKRMSPAFLSWVGLEVRENCTWLQSWGMWSPDISNVVFGRRVTLLA